MSLLDQIVERAKAAKRHIVLAEGEDPRIIEAAVRAVRDGLARVTLVGRADHIDLGGVEIAVIDPATSDLTDGLAAAYFELRKTKGVDEAGAAEALRDPLVFAAMMVREGHGDGTIAGAVATTADTIRAAIQCIGRAEDVRVVSSFFLIVAEEPHHVDKQVFFFADCGLVVDPNPVQLAQIAVSTAASRAQLIGDVPEVAMLSFSTLGSANHARVDHVVEALELAKEQAPGLAIDGELQFDAAIVPDIAASKAPGSAVAGHANVLVFPTLEAGNAGYKIAQRLGGCKAIGPVLQGLAKPANDLSRGCTADDVYFLIAVTAVQAG